MIFGSMRITRLFALALLALFLPLGGCLSGQTGSPDCVGPTECLCSTLYSGGNVLRVHVESSTTDKLTAVVDQDIASVYGAPPVAVGVRIGGSLGAEKPCAPGVSSAPPAGADLLVFFFHSSDPLDGSFVWAIPWAETLDFGAEHLLASSDLDVLSSPEACLERFPYGPAPACEDTINAGPCTIARLNPQPTYPGSALVGIVLLGAFLRRLSRAGMRQSLIRGARLR